MNARRPAPSLSKNQVRIIAGRLRGRVIRFPELASRPGFRPTPDRVRETLFNWLGQDLTGLSCLDAFTGSGALALEAASRGAARVLALDSDRQAIAHLRRQAELFGCAQLTAVQADALVWLRQSQECFDVIFLDPPFAAAPWSALEALLAARVLPGGMVYAEADRDLTAPVGFEPFRQGRAGRVHYHLFRRQDSEPASSEST